MLRSTFMTFVCPVAGGLCRRGEGKCLVRGEVRFFCMPFQFIGDLLQLYCFSALFLLMNRCSSAVAVAISTGLQKTASITIAYA